MCGVVVGSNALCLSQAFPLVSGPGSGTSKFLWWGTKSFGKRTDKFKLCDKNSHRTPKKGCGREHDADYCAKKGLDSKQSISTVRISFCCVVRNALLMPHWMGDFTPLERTSQFSSDACLEGALWDWISVSATAENLQRFLVLRQKWIEWFTWSAEGGGGVVKWEQMPTYLANFVAKRLLGVATTIFRRGSHARRHWQQ